MIVIGVQFKKMSSSEDMSHTVSTTLQILVLYLGIAIGIMMQGGKEVTNERDHAVHQWHCACLYIHRHVTGYVPRTSTTLPHTN